MQLKGIYGAKPTAKKEPEFFLHLVKVNDYIELQAVDEKGNLVDAGHLMRFEKKGDKIEIGTYTSVSDELPFTLMKDGRLKIEGVV
jgi:CheY-specific phosphatase CheX